MGFVTCYTVMVIKKNPYPGGIGLIILKFCNSISVALYEASQS